MSKTIEQLRAETAQYAVEHITSQGMHTGIAWLRDSFNDLYDAMGTPSVRMSQESEVGHRRLLAQQVAMDCIHRLNSAQLQQLDHVLEEIAKTPINQLKR